MSRVVVSDEEFLAKMRELDPENKGVGPTQIGLAFGIPYISASAWAHPRLQRLIKAGRVEKLPNRTYRVK